MVLLAPVVDTKGRLILPKGAELSPHVLGRLARFGVTHVDIQPPDQESGGDEEGAEPQAASIDEEQLTREIHQRFEGIGDDERMIVIRDAVTRQLVRSGVSKPI